MDIVNHSKIVNQTGGVNQGAKVNQIFKYRTLKISEPGVASINHSGIVNQTFNSIKNTNKIK